MRKDRTPEVYREVLESNLEEIDRMSRIVDELLFLSRADLGEIKIEKEPVQLEHLIQDIQHQAQILGKDREVIKNAVEGKVKVSLVDDLNGALVLANSLSNKGDVVLLSPACSSIDMYQDYQERGEKFKQLAGFD